MRQFFVDAELSDGGTGLVEGENFQHLSRSLRARLGEPVRLVDSGFRAFHGVIASFSGSAVTVAGLQMQAQIPQAAALCLGLCMPATDAFESALDAAVQLGADRIVPLSSDFSKKPDDKKISRWQRIIREACCQSLRARPPELEASQNLRDFFESHREGRKFLAWQGAKETAASQNAEAVTLLVGPEGGFSEAELGQARTHGWEPLNLGPHVLRVPVAVAAGLAVIQRMRYL